MGSPEPDSIPPTVEILSPPDLSFVRGGDQVEALVTDDQALWYAELDIDPDVTSTLGAPPFEWKIPDTTLPGERVIRVRGYDEAGHDHTALISVYMASGSEPSCEGSDDCEAGFVCLPEGICVPEDYTVGALGNTCAGDEECVSTVCGQFEDQSRCTRACDDDAVCPGGFECTDDGLCALRDSGGCLGCTGSGEGPPLPLVLLVALALLRPRLRSHRR